MSLTLFQRGNRLTARALNRTVEWINEFERARRDEPRDMSGGVRSRRMVVIEVYGDYLVCNLWDGTNLGRKIKVAKPYKLRQTPFDGETVTIKSSDITYTYDATNPEYKRSADDGTTTETQVIIPHYTVRSADDDPAPTYPYDGDVIWATFAPPGGTGVIVSGEKVVWLDENRDGRAWSKEAS